MTSTPTDRLMTVRAIPLTEWVSCKHSLSQKFGPAFLWPGTVALDAGDSSVDQAPNFYNHYSLQSYSENTTKLQQRLQEPHLQRHQFKTQNNMDTTQATYNDTREYSCCKRITDRKNSEDDSETTTWNEIQTVKNRPKSCMSTLHTRRQNVRDVRNQKSTQELYEYAAYATSERTRRQNLPYKVQQKNVTRKAKHSKISAQCK